MREGSDFIFESVERLDYKLHKIKLKRGGSYIKSPKWIRNKRATINSKNEDDNCFQYTLTVAFNYQNIENNPERIPNIKPFIDKYKWKDIDFSVHQNSQEQYENSIKIMMIDYGKFEQSNETIALNILYVPYNKK